MFSRESEQGRNKKEDLGDGFSRETTLDTVDKVVVFNRKLSIPDTGPSTILIYGASREDKTGFMSKIEVEDGIPPGTGTADLQDLGNLLGNETEVKQLPDGKESKDIFNRMRRRVENTIVDFWGRIGVKRG